MPRWTVEVTGLRQVFNALDETDKKASKLLSKEITKVGRRVAVDASYFAPGKPPLSNLGQWNDSRRNRDLGYDGAAVSKSFKVRRNNYRRRGVSRGVSWDVFDTNAAGAIFEILGSGSRITTPQGAHMVKAINERFPQRQPRALFRAYYQNVTPEVRQRIAAMITDAARKAGLV